MCSPDAGPELGKPLTLGDLETLLHKLKKQWTARDARHLGRWKDQAVYLDCFNAEGHGIINARSLYYDPELGVIISDQ